MKLLKELNEAADNNVGLVVSFVDGKFEDLAFVTYDTHKPLPAGHTKNLTLGIVSNIKKHGDNNFGEFAKFVRKNYHGKQIEGYSVGADLLFGPFNDSSLSKLDDAYLKSIGYDQEKEGEKVFGKKQWQSEREH